MPWRAVQKLHSKKENSDAFAPKEASVSSTVHNERIFLIAIMCAMLIKYKATPRLPPRPRTRCPNLSVALSNVNTCGVCRPHSSLDPFPTGAALKLGVRFREYCEVGFASRNLMTRLVFTSVLISWKALPRRPTKHKLHPCCKIHLNYKLNVVRSMPSSKTS